MRSLALALIAAIGSAGLGSVAGCSEHVGVAADGDTGALEGAPSKSAPLASGVVLEEVAVFQGTRVSVAARGVKVTKRTMPIVAGRDALVRAYVNPSVGASARSIIGELSLVRAGVVVATFKDTIVVSRRSQEEVPATTFNFDVPGAKLTSDVAFMVRLLDPGTEEVATSAENAAQYPVDGRADPLEAQHAVDKLRVVLVPIRYVADGSNRLPDTSAAVLDALRKRLLEFYPVPDVELTLHAPIDHTPPVLPNGNGWDQLLQRVTQQRLAENAPSDVYYYGAVAPAATLSQFCAGECVRGLSNFGDNAADAAQHASVGALYATTTSIDTLPHELGHAHGRMHAPCGGAAGVDPAYPYEGARTGGWGYSIVTKALKPPTSFDQMSYCTPTWQSDYTYAGLFERLRQVGGARIGTPPSSASGATANAANAADHAYRMLSVNPDGTVAWSGEPFRTEVVLVGKPQRVAFVGDDDALVGETTAHAYAYDHLEGGHLIVPYDQPVVATARLRIDLRASASAEVSAMMAPVRQRFGEFVDVARACRGRACAPSAVNDTP